MADIFLSYSQKNRKRARVLFHALEAAGFDVWMDHRLKGSDSYYKETQRELDLARCVLVVWSKTSVESDWVLSEASAGLTQKKLVSVRIDNVLPPGNLAMQDVLDFQDCLHKHGHETWQRLVERVSDVVNTSPAVPLKRFRSYAIRKRLLRMLEWAGTTIITTGMIFLILAAFDIPPFNRALPLNPSVRVSLSSEDQSCGPASETLFEGTMRISVSADMKPPRASILLRALQSNEESYIFFFGPPSEREVSIDGQTYVIRYVSAEGDCRTFQVTRISSRNSE